MVSHWSLGDSKTPQVSRTLLSILADLNNAVVWMVSTRPLISKFSCPCNIPNLLHSLIMWLIVLSLSSQNLYILFICVLSILALIWLVLMALFWAAIKILVFLRFRFLSLVHVFSYEMSFIRRLKRPYSCFSSYFCYFRFVYPRVVSIVSGGCNQSSSTLFYVVFKSLYWCVNTLQCGHI